MTAAQPLAHLPEAALLAAHLSATPTVAQKADAAAREVFGVPDAGLRERIAQALDEASARKGGGIWCALDDEEDRLALADAMTVVSRYTEQVAAGRETARRTAAEIEADRDRLAADSPQ